MARLSALKDTGWLTVILILLFGAIGSVLAVQLGYATPEAISRYGMWVVLALIALILFSRETKTEWDNIISSYLLLTSMGGLVATYMIQQGMRAGYILLGALLLFFIVLLMLYSRHGFRKTILARFK